MPNNLANPEMKNTMIIANVTVAAARLSVLAQRNNFCVSTSKPLILEPLVSHKFENRIAHTPLNVIFAVSLGHKFADDEREWNRL